MTCDEIREALAADFDDGHPHDASVLAHVALCASCRRYSDSLDALDASLYALPLESNAPLIDGRKWNREITPYTWRTPVFAAAVAAALAVVLGALLPLPIDPVEWFQAGARYVAEFPSIREIVFWTGGMAAQLWQMASVQFSRLPAVSPEVAWGAIIGSLLILALFNGYEAQLMQSWVGMRHQDLRRRPK